MQGVNLSAISPQITLLLLLDTFFFFMLLAVFCFLCGCRLDVPTQMLFFKLKNWTFRLCDSRPHI